MFPRVSDAQDVCTGFPASAGLGDTITAGRVWCSGGHTAPSPGWHRPGGCRAVHPAAFVQESFSAFKESKTKQTNKNLHSGKATSSDASGVLALKSQ